ncbi:M15 family metallopeptidase [Dysgonomonas sp. HDW5A]|uniref:M15 family metallopeptidase n=1 Tax=Dysgonomonas sp. HDW5A TaxID=2714926 RepID=UPI002104366E|nr:M15 family metallopeptidase [Dysgonomonas sp. HDW5A]
MKMQLLSLIISLPFFIFSCQNKPESNRVESPIEDSIHTDTIIVREIEEQVPAKSSMALYLEEQGLVNIHSLDSTIHVDLKYATTDNFTKEILYDDLTEAYLHPIAAQKLAKAQQLLKEIDPDLSLLVYDAGRPMSVQKKMYKVVQNTPYREYVADPSKTGMHNYGMAVDLTICRSDGTALDMGTSFDFFGKAAGINQEEQLLNEGLLTREQINNRKLLRKVMTEAGFITIRGEWWHFNAVSRSEAKRDVNVIE